MGRVVVFVSDGHFSLVLTSFSFCGVTESGGRGLAIAPSAFVAVSMIASMPPVVLAACSTTLMISLPTVVLLALILPSSKLRDISRASAAGEGSSNGKNNMAKLPYLTLTLLPTVIAMSPLNGTLALLAVAGCTRTATGGFGSVVFFAVVLAGVLCSKRLCFAALPVATAVPFVAAGVTVAGLSGLVAVAIPPFGLRLVLIRGAMVVDVMFDLWLCVLCQICRIYCNLEE
jgi:hypothetical protein